MVKTAAEVPAQEVSAAAPNIAGRATKAVNVLFFAMLAVLVCAAVAISVGVYFYTRNQEETNFEVQYEADASKLVSSFRDAVEHKLGALNNFANTFTSYALATNSSFPFVTLPNYAVRGQDMRIASESYIVHWLPLVTNETREDWEKYSYENRGIFDDELSEDVRFRTQQDDAYFRNQNNAARSLQTPNANPVNETLADDGSGFHKRIWNFGAIGPRGDMPDDAVGPFLPIWQSSPINPTKKIINLDFSKTHVALGILPAIQNSSKAVLYKAVVPIDRGRQQLEANLRLSQYRHEIDDYLDDPTTFLGYPVFDGFGDERKLAGVLISPLYWRLVLSNSLSPTARGLICVLRNSFNETLSYRIDGPNVTFIGKGDNHSEEFDEYEVSQNVNSYLQRSASPSTRSYTTVPLHEEYGVYEVRVYPSKETRDVHMTGNPVGYSLLVAAAFIVPTIMFLLFGYVVERRQRFVMQSALAHAKRAVETERELNEYLSHEVRNPLAAAMSACTFVSTSMNDPAALQILADNEKMGLLRSDLSVIESSLTFINDMLRSMLDLHRSDEKKLILHLVPVDLLNCVLEPVRTMLTTHDTNFDVVVECPDKLVVLTDSLRIKQIVLNLAINSSKFVTKGFIRMRAEMKGEDLFISVEDSGPGIPVEKQREVFQKFQASLDVLSQGTGLGLSLCFSLAKSLGGTLWMDKKYNSGMEGCPGTRFVLQLHQVHESLQPETSQSMCDCLSDDKRRNDIDLLPEEYSVLFVDDDQMLRKLFVRAVTKVAPTWTIKEAANGETAIRMNEDERFDLIFMDQYMASVEKQKLGTQTIRELRSKGVDSKICGLSANAMEEAFRDAGADCFVLKPMPCKKAELTKLLVRMTASEE